MAWLLPAAAFLAILGTMAGLALADFRARRKR